MEWVHCGGRKAEEEDTFIQLKATKDENKRNLGRIKARMKWVRCVGVKARRGRE